MFHILTCASVIATSSARLYELTEMVESRDFTSELHIRLSIPFPKYYPLTESVQKQTPQQQSGPASKPTSP